VFFLKVYLFIARVVDPDSLNTDPDPAFLLNPVPEPYPDLEPDPVPDPDPS
jgi:hypothetical protein